MFTLTPFAGTTWSRNETLLDLTGKQNYLFSSLPAATATVSVGLESNLAEG
jgi:hypothetical protein